MGLDLSIYCEGKVCFGFELPISQSISSHPYVPLADVVDVIFREGTKTW